MPVPTGSARPRLAGSYFDWEVEGKPPLPTSPGSTVALATTGDWGPVNTPILVRPTDGYGVFGSPTNDGDSPIHRAIRDAFKGQGVAGKSGASAVWAYRQAAAATAATKVLTNTAAATALTLTAKFPGTRANQLRFTVQPAAGGGNELLILIGNLVVERYQHTATDIAGLAVAINRSSDWVTAVVGTGGVALATTSGSTPTTNGTDGTTITGTEWTATMNALDLAAWRVFAPYGLTDATIRATLVAWIKSRNLLGLRSFMVVGGAAAETLTTATARGVAINHWDILNLGRGTLRLTDEQRDVSTAEFVARYAGARAWRGESRDDFMVRFANVDVTDGPSLSEQVQALDGGTIVFAKDRDPNTPVHVKEAVTSYVDASSFPDHTVEHYRRVKNVAIQHGVEMEIQEWAMTGNVIGELPVNTKTRELVLGRVKLAYKTREDAGVVQPGWTAYIDGTISDDDDFVSYVHGFHPTRSLRQMFHQAKVG